LAQQLFPANPHGTCAFAAGANEAVSNVVGSGLIVTVSPAVPPLLLYVLVESSDAWMVTPKPAVSTAAAPTPAAIDLMILYISTSQDIHCDW
jgi:hypothetical protein